MRLQLGYVEADKPILSMQEPQDKPVGLPVPAGTTVWHANLPDISQRTLNAAAKVLAQASVGDKLVESLSAQSLDLPPQAAKVSCHCHSAKMHVYSQSPQSISTHSLGPLPQAA